MNYLLSIILCTLGPLAHAADLNLRDGQYGEGYGYQQYYGNPPQSGRFELRKRGSRVILRDNKRNIVYNLDLSNAAEQSLPPRFIELLASNPKNGSTAKLIQNISVSGIRQGEGPDQIFVHVNVYFGMASTFGSVQGKMQVDVKVTSKEVEYQVFKDGDFRPQKANVVLLNGAGDTRLLSLKTSLGPQADQIMGLILDLGIRLVDPGLMLSRSIDEVVR